MQHPAPLRCAQCGAPLGGGANGLTCSFCKAVHAVPRPSDTELRNAVRGVLREDRNRNGIPDAFEGPPPPPRPIAPVRPAAWSAPAIVGVVIAGLVVLSGITTGIFFALYWQHPAPERPPAATPPKPELTMPATVTAPAETSAPAPAQRPNASPARSATAPKLSNEQYGKKMVTSAGPRLKQCVEQHLLRTPSAPTAYTATVSVEQDGLPRNSSTRFTPSPGNENAETCMKLAIFHAFNNGHTAPPTREEFTFTTSFAFPDAKPAAKRDTTWE